VYAGVEVLRSCLAKAQCLVTPNLLYILGVQDKSVSSLCDKVKGRPLCANIVSSQPMGVFNGTPYPRKTRAD
jgi:hypothetical protein